MTELNSNIYKSELERVKDITQSILPTWITYITVIGFVFISAGGIDDEDYFSINRSINVPVIGNSVSVTMFLIFSGLVTTMIFGYLHMALHPLWYALGRLPSRVGGAALGTQIHPWLVSEFALDVRRRLSPKELPCVSAGPLAGIGTFGTFIILYLSVPALLAMLWLRSQPAHLWWLTAPLGGMLAVVLWISYTGWADLCSNVTAKELPKTSGWRERLIKVVVVSIILVTSVLRSSWDVFGTSVPRGAHLHGSMYSKALNWFRPPRAWMGGAELSIVPDGWLSYETARMAFRAEWCDRAASDCDPSKPYSVNFEREWLERRRSFVETGPDLSLAGRDLRFADLSGSYLAGANLRSTRLDQASLWYAELEGVDLSFSNLSAINLLETHLDRADLSYSLIAGPNAVGDLISTEGTTWENTDVHAAAFRSIDLVDAISRGGLDIADSFGDGTVILPSYVHRPCHWRDEKLSDEDFFAGWRGWVERSPRNWGWRWMAPAGFEGVRATDPPVQCSPPHP